MQHRLGADHDPRAGRRHRRRRPGDLGDRLARPGPRAPRAPGSRPGAAPSAASRRTPTHTTGRVGAAPGARAARSSSGWATAASHRSQRASSPHARAGQQPGPARAVEHAHHPAVARAAARTSAGGSRPGARVLAAPVDDVDDRPPGPLLRPRDGASRRARGRAPRATGTARSARRARPPAGPARAATSRACHVGACSSWWASSCSSSTTTAARPPTGAHAAARAPTTRARPAAPSAQSRGMGGHAGRRRAAGRGATAAATGAVGHRHQGVAPPRRGQRHAGGVGRGRQPQHGPARAEGVARPGGDRVDRVPPATSAGAAGAGAGRPATCARATPCAGSDAGRPGPPPRRPRGQVDEVGPGPRPDHLGQRPQRRPRPAGRRRPRRPTRRPAGRARATRTTVPDAHLVPERVGDQVVEGLVDGRLVGQDPDDLPAAAAIRGADGAAERAQRPSADFRSSTRVVCSQVKSLSARPKCP